MHKPQRSFPLAALLGGAAFMASAQSVAPMRPPAVPLVTHDPYFSIWSAADRLSDTGTTHWTGKPNTLTALIRVDGRVFDLTGPAGRGGRGAANSNALEQVRVEVLPTRTVYELFARAHPQDRLAIHLKSRRVQHGRIHLRKVTSNESLVFISVWQNGLFPAAGQRMTSVRAMSAERVFIVPKRASSSYSPGARYFS